MHRYGVIFWNEETDNEICVYVEAKSYWEAYDLFEPYNVVEYEKGNVSFLDKGAYADYKIKLEDLYKHCILHMA